MTSGASSRVPGKFPAPSSSPVADRIRERRGSRGLTALDAVLLHAPNIADGWNSLLRAVRTTTVLPPDIREAIILRVAAHNNAAFEWIHHEQLARDAGLSTAHLQSIRNTSIQPVHSSDTLTSLQVAALTFADSSTKHIAVPDDVFRNLERELRSSVSSTGDDASSEDRVQTMLVEAAAIVATYNMVSRFLVSLDVAVMSDDPVPWPADRQEHKVVVPSCTLHVETLTVNSTPRWLVLANSLLTNTTLWSPIIPDLLADGYNIIVFDQRGHGRSSVPSPPHYSIADLADDIALILAHLQIPRICALIGVSQGGAAALSFAIRHANKTARVIACDTQAMSPASNRLAWDDRIQLAQTEGMSALAVATAKRWFPLGSAYHPDGGRKAHVVCRMIEDTDFAGFKAGARSLQTYDLLEAGLLRSNLDTLLIAGEEDGVIPTKMLKLKSDWMREGGVVASAIIKGSGHLPMLDNPNNFLQVVLGFLNG